MLALCASMRRSREVREVCGRAGGGRGAREDGSAPSTLLPFACERQHSSRRSSKVLLPRLYCPRGRPVYMYVLSVFTLNVRSKIPRTDAMEGAVSQPRIRPLDQQCINRIAAGEVIHRPASAVRDPRSNSGTDAA